MTPMTLFDALSRDDDPSTSQQAAQGDRARLEQAVLDAVRAAGWSGATTDEAWGRLVGDGWQVRPNSVARRLTTLSRLGLVELAGTRPGDSGRNQQVWRAVGHMMKEAV